MEGPHFPYDTQEQAEEAAISAHEQRINGGRYGRWAWTETTDDDRLVYQIPDEWPRFIVFQWDDDEPVTAYCSAWYEADTVARGLWLADEYRWRTP